MSNFGPHGKWSKNSNYSSIQLTATLKMSEKLCLKWNDFKDNVNSAFGSLRGDVEVADVTLACEDGQ